MSKKRFAGGLDSLLGLGEDTPQEKVRTKAVDKESLPPAIKEGESRATFVVNDELLDKVKAAAYWEGQSLKEAINEALEQYVEKKNPKPRPEKKRLREQIANQKLIKKPDIIARLPKY